jgi:hypothetical protein
MRNAGSFFSAESDSGMRINAFLAWCGDETGMALDMIEPVAVALAEESRSIYGKS